MTADLFSVENADFITNVQKHAAIQRSAIDLSPTLSDSKRVDSFNVAIAQFFCDYRDLQSNTTLGHSMSRSDQFSALAQNLAVIVEAYTPMNQLQSVKYVGALSNAITQYTHSQAQSQSNRR
jgi:hypothetical protein